MKLNALHIILMALSIWIEYPVAAQNYVQDMGRIEQKFKEGDLSFKVKYLFYPYDSLKKVSDSMNAVCSQSNGEYYYKIATDGKEYEYLKNSKYFFVVDHAEKGIAIRKSSEAQQQAWDISRIDSIIRSPSVKVNYKSLGNSEAEYEVKLSEGVWTTIKLIFNTTTFRIDKLYMYSTRKGKMLGQNYSNPRIGIVYSDYSNGRVDKTIFNESRFFTETTEGGVTLNELYKKYKVLNYLQKRS